MSEKTKLETMFYHSRTPKHIRWLEANVNYRNERTLVRASSFRGTSPDAFADLDGLQVTEEATSSKPVRRRGDKCVFCGNWVFYAPGQETENPHAHTGCWLAFKSSMLSLQ